MDLEKLLSPEHLAQLRRGSGISDAIILERGYRTIVDNARLSELGFAPSQQRAPGLLVPIWTTAGQNELYQFKPDSPRVREHKDKRNPYGSHPVTVIKYETPKGASIHLDIHPTCKVHLGDPSVNLWITEGVKKADALVSRGLCAIALLGVWNWRGKNDLGGLTALSDWEDVALKGRKVHVVFDNDVMRKVEVKDALKRFTAWLQNRGAFVDHIYLPASEQKIGVDDWLVSGHSVEELEALIEAPRLQPQPAQDVVELLDFEPPTIRRPLALIDGVSYAVCWVNVHVTRSESVGKNGEIIRHQPPKQFNERRLFIMRGDGVTFGDDFDHSIDELGLIVDLPEMPRTEKLWSVPGIKAYKNGEKPDPVSIFRDITKVIDNFLDFKHSLADQPTMTEAVACYILATWLLDAFDVIGFLWPNGERGSGKTQLLVVITEMAYLGELITAGGTFASLRDMADYGAALAFDDAESLSDPKKTDPDKRALLLAGNRRGVSIPLKEATSDRNWKTRYVNCFCPRIFSAIRLPDQTLASRTIIVPLIRTNDRAKSNIDPKDNTRWPVNRAELLDRLWAMALANLPELPKWNRWVADHATLEGRNLQPWWAILAVAAWLDDRGEKGLWDRMNNLSYVYHTTERQKLELPDLTTIVIKAIVEIAKSKLDVWGVQDIWDVNLLDSKKLIIETKDVTDAAVKLVDSEELDFDKEYIVSRRVGRVLSKLRLEKDPAHKGARGWQISIGDIRGFAETYGVGGPPTDVPNVQDVPNEEATSVPAIDKEKAVLWTRTGTI